MKILQRICSAALALLLLFAAALPAAGATVYTYGEWSFVRVNAGRDFELYAYTGTDAEVTVPSKVDQYKVVSVGAYAFSGLSTLERVTLPSTVTAISDYAFLNCAALAAVTLPDSCTAIGDSAFRGCASLAELSIPASVTEIGESAFLGCDSLTIVCDQGSYAEQYAIAYDIPYRYAGALSYVLGDADGNGEVDIVDVTVIQRWLAGVMMPDPEQIKRCGDVNGNGLDIVDATWIQRWLANLEVPYPINERVALAA